MGCILTLESAPTILDRYIFSSEKETSLTTRTTLGHLEGSAGLAGLLKGSASIQNGAIAPNLLFNRLNPAIEPFYKGLNVPTQLIPWPKLPEGVPRRVSVNSFGMYLFSNASPKQF